MGSIPWVPVSHSLCCCEDSLTVVWEKGCKISSDNHLSVRERRKHLELLMLWYSCWSWALDLHREMQNVNLGLECPLLTEGINGNAGEENRFIAMLVIPG